MHRIPGGSLDEEGRTLVESLGGRWTRRGGMCRCPAHADRSPSLSVRPGRSRLLLHCFAGCQAADVLRALKAGGLIDPAAGPLTGHCADQAAPVSSAAALRLWGGGRPLEATPAAAYLAARGIETEPPELRYHPRTPQGPWPSTRFRPAMIAAVRDETGLVAVHRSFLDPRRPRLLRCTAPKCGLGPFGRGAVRLGGVSSKLGLAEGIETALSAAALFGHPCWATLGTERFGLVQLPAGVTELILFLDNDAGGQRAEALAREAFSAIPVIKSLCPPRAGDDWNDVLRAARSNAIPK